MRSVVDGTTRSRRQTGWQRKPGRAMRVLRASVGRRLHRVPVRARRGLVRRLQPARRDAQRPPLDAPPTPPSAPDLALPSMSTVPEDEFRARRRPPSCRVVVLVVARPVAAVRPATSRGTNSLVDDDRIGDDVKSSTSWQVTPSSSPTAAAAAAAFRTDRVNETLSHRNSPTVSVVSVDSTCFETTGRPMCRRK